MKIYARMLKWVKSYWKVLSIGLLSSLLYVMFNSASVWLTASFVNVIFPQEHLEVVQNQSTKDTVQVKNNLNNRIKNYTNNILIKKNPRDSLMMLCIVIIFTFIVKNIFFYLKNISFGYVQLKLIMNIRNQLYEHLHNLSLSYFHRKKGGELMSIVLNDVGVMQRAFTVSFDKLIVEPINIMTFMTLMFIISWKLSLMAFIILPVTFFLISKIGQSIRRKSVRTSKKIAGIMAILSETISGIRVVKAFAMEAFEKRRFFSETKKYFQLTFKRRRLRAISTPINESFSVFVGVILLWIGGNQVLSGNGIEAEDFIRFIILMFAILTPIRSLNMVNVDLQEGIASAQRVFSILDEKPDITEKPGAIQLTSFNSIIRYRNVGFQYNELDGNVLENIDLELNKGEIVAIIGHSGAGKSTLVDLLPRFYDVQSGSITIDGIDVRDVSLASLRSLMGIVTQQTILFNDTIFNNIAYGMSDADPELVITAAKAANAHEFIVEFPDKYKTVIGDQGSRLSGGQAQRIAIARALLKNPPILILDEATSSLDTESEQKVQSAIDRLMKDRTVFVIAHRLATIQSANKIVVMDKGRIVEQGCHQKLLDKGGIYRYLYDIQFKNINGTIETNNS
ncbi:MAG: ABC transporter ATP-binding protein [Candidatus Marinimicrobia bacterium]|nr:ABC transporter ATP-binding protein [Candidatus Neomarinimicrobiota bacterium]